MVEAIRFSAFISVCFSYLYSLTDRNLTLEKKMGVSEIYGLHYKMRFGHVKS